jgi:hypothetical protein
MRAYTASLVVSGVVASSAFGANSNTFNGSSDWALTLGGQSPLVSDWNFVPASSNASIPTIGMAQAVGNPFSFGDGKADREDSPKSLASASGEAGSVPTVPVPAPVLLAGFGVLGLVVFRKQAKLALR